MWLRALRDLKKLRFFQKPMLKVRICSFLVSILALFCFNICTRIWIVVYALYRSMCVPNLVFWICRFQPIGDRIWKFEVFTGLYSIAGWLLFRDSLFEGWFGLKCPCLTFCALSSDQDISYDVYQIKFLFSRMWRKWKRVHPMIISDTTKIDQVQSMFVMVTDWRFSSNALIVHIFLWKIVLLDLWCGFCFSWQVCWGIYMRGVGGSVCGVGGGCCVSVWCMYVIYAYTSLHLCM